MPTLDEAFDSIRVALKQHNGPATDDFEGLAPFQTMIAVFLDRELGSHRSRAALNALVEDDLIRPDLLANAEIPEIADALRVHGVEATARTIAPLKRLARWAAELGNTDEMSLDAASELAGNPPVSRLREGLGSIKGIGPALVDAIVLFALKRPSYPVDRASYRVLARHGWLDASASYDEARDCLVDHALSACDEDEQAAATALSDLSYGMEQLGRQYCRLATAQCRGCPLESLLPEGGPRELDA